MLVYKKQVGIVKQEMSYTSQDISVLEGLAPVRQVPAMYIGSVDQNGLHHCLQEVIDNSLDEHLAGYCDRVEIEIKDTVASVKDHGRGIPTDTHPSTGVSTVETVLTKLHAGGKFFGNGKTGYRVSSGLHGVGVSVVNALSSSFSIVVQRDGEIWSQEYSCGTPLNSLTKTGKSKETGTLIRFEPDASIFETSIFSEKILVNKLKELAYLNSKLTLDLNFNENLHSFHYEKGITQLLEDSLRENEEWLEDKIPLFEFSDEKYTCQVAMMWTNKLEEDVWSYVNNINTRSGGTHVTGVKTGITRALMSFNSEHKVIREDLNIMGEDLRSGLKLVVVLLHENPQFEGQTKHKLNNSDLRVKLKDQMVEILLEHFKKRPDLAVDVLKRAYQLASIRTSASKKKELATVRSKIDSTVLLPGRLTSCSSRDPEKCELFMVEGLSAAGSASKQRDSKYQSVLALKGKVINAFRMDEKAVFKNQELSSLLVALGIGSSFDYNKLRYNKVIILTDADHDGEHIKALLLIYFITYLSRLVEEGKLYIAQPPLYRVKGKRSIRYLKNDLELKEYLGGKTQKERQSLVITRMKGLGEMNSDELYETTMCSHKRDLLQVSMEDRDSVELVLEKWSGVDSTLRKQHILKELGEDM